MLFNSLSFALFFPLVTLLYFVLPHRVRWLHLLAASCLFYMAFVPAYILILAVTIVVDYVAGILIERSQGARRRAFLVLSIITNVGFLAFFKYFNFANENLAALARALDWNYSLRALQIALPIGLSFHTFQAMSYTIEVYRGKQPAERHFGIYALYVMFYPQLVAGPIERPQNLLPQFRAVHRFDYRRVTDGLKLMAWGLIKKVVVADRLTVLVDRVYGAPHSYGPFTLAVATVFFALQIYCDFSGYTDVARGAARVMGFELMRNFDFPYSARSISEFWARWHISLSTWFRDYLYIPLGGNRVSTARWYANLLFVFLLSGLWHGANWTFVVWGAIHGSYLVVSLMTAKVRERLAVAVGLTRAPRLRAALQTFTTFVLVCIGWVFFRAKTVSDAAFVIEEVARGALRFVEAPAASLLTLGAQVRADLVKAELSRVEVLGALGALLGLEAVQLLQRRKNLARVVETWPPLGRWLVYEAVVIALVFFGKYTAHQFIYFQF